MLWQSGAQNKEGVRLEICETWRAIIGVECSTMTRWIYLCTSFSNKTSIFTEHITGSES